MITFTSPVRVKSFESMIPVLTKQFRYACRNMKNEGEKEEAIQDMLSLAFIGYKSLVDRKLYNIIYSTPLGDYSIRLFLPDDMLMDNLRRTSLRTCVSNFVGRTK